MMKKDEIDKYMEKLLKKLLKEEEFYVLRKIIESHGKLKLEERDNV